MQPTQSPNLVWLLFAANVVLIIISGLVAYIASDLKSTIKELKQAIKEMVGESVCKARMETHKTDLNNLGTLVRNHSHE